jgi:integrase
MNTVRDKLYNQLNGMIAHRRSLGYKETTTYSTLHPFIDYCCENFPDATEITEDMLSSWLTCRKYKSPNTVNSFLACFNKLSSFIRLCGESAYLANDGEYQKTGIEFVPTLLNDEQIKLLFHTIDTTLTRRKCDPPTEIISPVLFRFMYCAGMRPAEPLHLLKDDVNLVTGDVYIRKSKNNKDRHIIVSEDLRNLCVQFDSLQDSQRTYFFEHNKSPLSRTWMTPHFVRLTRKSNIGNASGKLRPYDLRHMFASRTIMKWIDNKQEVMELLPYLSVYMGHENINSTLYYVHLLPERLKTSSGIDWNVFNSVYRGTYEG